MQLTAVELLCLLKKKKKLNNWSDDFFAQNIVSGTICVVFIRILLLRFTDRATDSTTVLLRSHLLFFMHAIFFFCLKCGILHNMLMLSFPAYVYFTVRLKRNETTFSSCYPVSLMS